MDDTVGTEAKMTMCFINIASSFLALIPAVQENNFERHFQKERETVKYCFAFDHINYARYVSYQQVYLPELQSIDRNAMMDLTQRGFGGSLSDDSFSCLHGDLITEILSGQTKKQADPHCTGFSTDIAKVKTWVATSHIHAKVRQTLSDKIQLNTSTGHKECTSRARRLHSNNVELLKEKMKSYGTDPFGAGNARYIGTGKELLEKVVENLMKVDKIGDEIYLSFVNEHLIKGKADFSDPIKKVNLDIGS